MRDRDLYATILGLTAPWKVTDVELDAKLEVVAVSVKAEGRSALVCPAFRSAILFHLGGLDLYPASVTHTES